LGVVLVAAVLFAAVHVTMAEEKEKGQDSPIAVEEDDAIEEEFEEEQAATAPEADRTFALLLVRRVWVNKSLVEGMATHVRIEVHNAGTKLSLSALARAVASGGRKKIQKKQTNQNDSLTRTHSHSRHTERQRMLL
jgi:hypothetical protein